jgi:hypothetical protein
MEQPQGEPHANSQSREREQMISKRCKSGSPSLDYRKAAQEAEAAVSGMSDADVRKAGFERILADKLGRQPLTSYWSDNANRCGLVISGALAAVGVVSLWSKWQSWTSFATILFIDAFILYLLVIVGLHADKRVNTSARLPHRLPAFVMGGLLFAGLLHAFGNLYRNSDVVCPKGAECSIDHAGSHIQKPSDALYFSAVTMTTLGYGDFYPGCPESRHIVIWQLGNLFGDAQVVRYGIGWHRRLTAGVRGRAASHEILHLCETYRVG